MFEDMYEGIQLGDIDCNIGRIARHERRNTGGKAAEDSGPNQGSQVCWLADSNRAYVDSVHGIDARPSSFNAGTCAMKHSLCVQGDDEGDTDTDTAKSAQKSAPRAGANAAKKSKNGMRPEVKSFDVRHVPCDNLVKDHAR
jgi:hypothetical protein